MKNLLLHLPKTSTLLIILFFSAFYIPDVFTQSLPNKIRGYKLHKTAIPIYTDDKSVSKPKKPYVLLHSFDFKIGNVSIDKTTWEVKNNFTVFGQSGKIDFIVFENFEINGVGVSISEYKNKFSFKKGKYISLNKPVTMSVGNLNGLKAALREIFKSKKIWKITGKMLVFGKFKKAFFKFRRVVPININLEIPSPL